MSDSVQSTRGNSSCPTEVLLTRCTPESEPGLYFLPEMLILESDTAGNDSDADVVFSLPFAGGVGEEGGLGVGDGGAPIDTTADQVYGGFFDFALETAASGIETGEIEFQSVIAPDDVLAIHLITEGLVLETAVAPDFSSNVGFQEINNTGSFGSPVGGPSGGSVTVLTEF